ncbi:MAG: permease [Eubacteriales bacterium]
MLAGVAIGAVIHNWIPEEWVVAVLGSKNPFGVVLATVLACRCMRTSSVRFPWRRALFAKGARLGSVISVYDGG